MEETKQTLDIKEINEKIERESAFVDLLTREINKVIVGQKYMIERLLIGLLGQGHILLEGVPGLAKTLAINTLSKAVQGSFSRIQFTPDLLPADVVGTMIYNIKESNFSIKKGPIFANFVLADEINRAPAKVQSALLEAMQEKSVTIGNTTYKLDPPFFVLATQNPLEMEGTYPLPEAQLDRFLFKLNVKFPSRDELHLIMERTTAKDTPKVEVATKKSRILEMRLMAREVPVARHVMDYALKLIQATHPNLPEAVEATRRYVRFGSSPRGAQAIIITAKIRALMQGRFNVSVEDVRHTAMAALRHRIILNFEGEAEGVQTDEILQEIIKKTAETKP